MSTDPQPLANEEIGFLVRMFRESLQWSQTTLAELCKVDVRTIQRVEKGEPSNSDTRRAIARAFELEDIEHFNKLHTVPTEEELKSAQEELQKNRLILDVTAAESGRDLASDFATSTGDVSRPAIELDQAAATEFAFLTDYLRDYRDCASGFSEVQKVEVFAEIQQHIDTLASLGISICYATRDTTFVGRNWMNKEPMPVRLLYLSAFYKGKVPSKMIVPKKVEWAF
jgi:transcriptional regulator with XRE-family HTH domain